MDALQRFVEELSDEDFAFLNANRALSQQLVDEHDLRLKAARGDRQAKARIAAIDRERAAVGSGLQPSRPFSHASVTGSAFAPPAAMGARPPGYGGQAPFGAGGLIVKTGSNGAPPQPGGPRPGATPPSLPNIGKIPRLPGWPGLALTALEILQSLDLGDEWATAEPVIKGTPKDGDETPEEREWRCLVQLQEDAAICDAIGDRALELQRQGRIEEAEAAFIRGNICLQSAETRYEQCKKRGRPEEPLDTGDEQ